MKVRWWGILAVLLLIGTAVFIGKLEAMNDRDRGATCFAFPDLQNAKTEAKAKEILTAWQPKNAQDPRRENVRAAIKADLWFPLFYASLFALLSWRASVSSGRRWVVVLGMIAAALAVVGGIFDILENRQMLSMLDDVNKAKEIGKVVILRQVKSLAILPAFVYVLLAHLETRKSSG